MDKFKFKESMISLDVQDYHLLLGALRRERSLFESLLDCTEPVYKKYYLDRIRRCNDLIDKFSICI